MYFNKAITNEFQYFKTYSVLYGGCLLAGAGLRAGKGRNSQGEGKVGFH